jgi:[protein-PII] uridylyltransferase
LEPNIKTSPGGGLRDIHTTLWVCNRQFGTTDVAATASTLAVLTTLRLDGSGDGMRFSLVGSIRTWHTLAGRKEDQLHFARQRELSQRLGFMDTESKSAVELFMQALLSPRHGLV